ncbi:serine/threonine-protein kinase [Streptomyces broussonetiae]|uniref:non-specific serine/threonine protein kinase n=1 Tax=Streptomyces broussonetiae TaxID=2686304 RepID=A0ABV5EEC5_9ACTN
MSSGEHGQGHGREEEGGRLLAGRYRVTARLGRGGMGVVWRAVDEVLGRDVALKELRTYTDAAGPELDDLRLRMRREARAAARVRHHGVIAVHDIAQVDGRPLIVMELVDGPSLDDVLAERRSLDPREAAGIGAKVMDALAAAHRAGVLHRDVKPGNILLDRSGRVVLTDFGIATMDDPGDGSATHLTRSGEIVGSLDYLAPERAQGGDPGPASDVWALGATLYAAVEGASPFRRTSTYSTLTAIVSEPPPAPRRAGALAPVLLHLLEKQPEARPDAERAHALLRAVADGVQPDRPTTTLRAVEPEPVRQETERVAPAVPPGFGAPGSGPGTRCPAAPGVPTGGQPPRGTAPTGPMNGPGPVPPRRKGRALLAAAAVTVLLATTGITVALLNNPGGTAPDAAPVPPSATASQDASDRPSDRTGSDGPAESEPGVEAGERGPAAAREADADPTDRATASNGPSPSRTSAQPDPTTAAPACHSIGGGKYNCQVWRTAPSYTAAGTEAGVLKAGINYFHCQRNLGRRETHGEWTNVWWGRTDDDSGNADVYVSAVYIQGGDNDAPVPGLPVC